MVIIHVIPRSSYADLSRIPPFPSAVFMGVGYGCICMGYTALDGEWGLFGLNKYLIKLAC